MKIGEFVKKNILKPNIDASRLYKAGFTQTEIGIKTDNIYFEKSFEDNVFESLHNGWRTNYENAHFKAKAHKIVVAIGYASGIIENTNETATQYYASVSVKGGIGYYRKGKTKQLLPGHKNMLLETTHEIYNLYDYDTNIEMLLDRILEYYVEFYTRDILPYANKQIDKKIDAMKKRLKK
jgi:hypothetical protein